MRSTGHRRGQGVSVPHPPFILEHLHSFYTTLPPSNLCPGIQFSVPLQLVPDSQMHVFWAIWANLPFFLFFSYTLYNNQPTRHSRVEEMAEPTQFYSLCYASIQEWRFTPWQPLHVCHFSTVLEFTSETSYDKLLHYAHYH